jgi:hypothetical protein
MSALRLACFKAISKALSYRYLNEPEEAESICRDILAVEPDHQVALRRLGLAITDQFTGNVSDRYAEAESVFQSLTERYERLYYTGLLHERQAKAQRYVRAGRCVRSWSSSRTRWPALSKPRKSARRITKMRSCDGTGVYGYCKRCLVLRRKKCRCLKRGTARQLLKDISWPGGQVFDTGTERPLPPQGSHDGA